MNSKICLILFVMVIVLFALPWVTVSCAGSTFGAVTISGLDMVTGKELPSPLGNLPDATKQQLSSTLGGINTTGTKLDTNLLVIGVLALAGAGILASLFWKGSSAARIIFSLLGIALLIAFKYQLDNRVSRIGYGLIQVNYLAGYWFTITAFGAAATVSFLKRDNNRLEKPSGVPKQSD